MNDHYFSSTPKVPSNPRMMPVTARGITVQMKTDAGVFSKSGLDQGTRILVEHVSLSTKANVVDLGCGYGPVTVILGTAYPDSLWTMVEVNERALQLAVENTQTLRERVKAIRSDGFELLSDTLYSDVILNPPIRAGKETIYRLFREAKRHLVSGGSLWIVIQKKHGAESTRKFLTELFQNVEICYKKSGYYVFRCF